MPPGRRVYPSSSSSSSSSSSIGSLSKDVFEGRTSTGSEPFSLFICLDANKFVLLSFFSLIKTIYQRVSTKPLPHDAKSPLPVDVCRSKTPSLKLPIIVIVVVVVVVVVVLIIIITFNYTQVNSTALFLERWLSLNQD